MYACGVYMCVMHVCMYVYSVVCICVCDEYVCVCVVCICVWCLCVCVFLSMKLNFNLVRMPCLSRSPMSAPYQVSKFALSTYTNHTPPTDFVIALTEK